MEPPGREPPFFIVGSARSGTTLLRLILNAHPEVAVPPESRFVTELWEGHHDIGRAPFLARLGAHPQFRRWELPLDEVEARLPKGERIPYAQAIDATFRAYADRMGRSRWGDKTPRYVEALDVLASLFPTARFVHLIRDGRNVALSYADMPFGPKTVGKAARLWARRVRAGMDGGTSLGERYKELRYEDLVADTEGQLRSLCDFLDLPFDPAMLDYPEAAKDAALPKAAKLNPHVKEKPKTTRTWQTTMPAAHVEIFESVAGDVLQRAGYERRFEAPRLSARLSGLLSAAGLPVAKLATTGRS
jgi:hypothetical protein